MLQDNDRIFTNIYGWHEEGLSGAKKRGDWDNTKSILALGHDEIVERMKLISKSRGANFLLIIENVNTNPESCLIDEPYSKELIVKLSEKSIPFVLTSEIYKNQKCENLQVKYDGHPSAYANMLVAEEVSNYIKNNSF